MLLHESCHFYGLQWLICLFKFSIKPGGTGRIRGRRAVCRCLCFARPLERYGPTWSQGSRWFCRRLTQPRAGGAANVGEIHFKRPRKDWEKKCKSKCFFSPPDKSFCLFLSFVQVALSRVMPLKCQLSAWARIALDIKYSSPHTKTAVSCGVIQKEIKYGARTSFSPSRPCALIICQSDRCFSNDGVSCELNFYQSSTVRDCQTLHAIWWWKPPWAKLPRAAGLPSGKP